MSYSLFTHSKDNFRLLEYIRVENHRIETILELSVLYLFIVWAKTSMYLVWFLKLIGYYKVSLVIYRTAQSAEAVQYTNGISVDQTPPHPAANGLHMTLNHLMVRHQAKRFGKCGELLNCYHSQVHSGLEL